MRKLLNKYWTSHSVEMATVAGCLALVGLVSSIAWVSYDRQSVAEREFHVRQGTHQALLLEVNTRDTMASLEDALIRIKREFESAGTRLDLKRLMADYRDIAEHVAVASVADRQGKLVLSTLPIPASTSIADLRHFRAHINRDKGEQFIGWPAVGRVSGKWSFHISLRINRPDGTFGGVAVIAVDFSYWARLHREDGASGQETVVVLLGTDGRARSIHGPGHEQSLMAADWGFVSTAAGATGTRGAVEGPPELPGTWVYRAVQGYPLIVAVRLDQEALGRRLQEIRNNHNAALFSVVILLILMAGLLLKFLSRQRQYYQDQVKIAGVLRQSEERFRAIFESAGVGISLRYAHDRRLPWIAVNDRFCEITGYNREELLRMSTADITPGDTQERAASDNRNLLSGEVHSYVREKRLICKDGSERWVMLSVALVPDAAGRPYCIMSTYQDIHASKMAEAQLQASEERLRAIIAAEPECVAIVSPAGDLLEMNPAGLRMLEADRLEELQAAPFIRLIAPRYRKPFIRLRNRVRHGESGVLEFEAIGLRGKHCWLEIHAAPLRDERGDIYALLGISRDVTEQREAREALAAEHNLLRALVDNMPDPVHVKDAQLRYVLANSAWMRARASGWADITGKTTREVINDPRKQQQIEAEDRGVIESGQPIPLRIESTEVPGLGLRWYIVAKLPLLDQTGRISGLISINRDITEIRQRTEEVEQLNAELEQRVEERTTELAAANEELEAFAASVSHDLRAPLRHIDGFSGLLLEDCGDTLSAAGRNYLDRIRNASSRMSALIEDLLRLSRLMRGDLHLTDVDLGALATELVEDLRRDQSGRKVKVTIAPGLQARCDAGLLRAALANLLQNAWKFTGKREDAAIEFSASLRDGIRVFCVRDNGAGFDMAYAGRLFGTFQRLHHESEFTGTGVGLATVRRIVRRHGGDVWAESAVNEGASFYFTLGRRPADYGLRAPASLLLAAEPHPPVNGVAQEKPILLLVDDDADVLELSSRMLRPDRYEVLTAESGEQALALLRKHPVQAVVSDFSMPGMDGAKLLALAAQLHPQSLRLIVSSQEINQAMQTGLQRGDIHHYFGKQQDYQLVRDCIRAWVAARSA